MDLFAVQINVESLSRQVRDTIRFEVEVIHFKRGAHQQEFAITPLRREFVHGDSAVIPDTLSDGCLALRPFAVIEFGHEPVLHTGRQGDVTETPGSVFLHLVLLLGGMNRGEAPDPLLRQRFANGLPVTLPFPIPVDRAVRFQCVRCADDFVILALLGFCRFDVLIPKGSGVHSDHIALEFGHRSRSGHGFAEVDILIAIDSQHTDHEWHFRSRKILAHIADEVRQEARVFIIVVIWIGSAIDQVVETLKPDKAGQLKARLLVVFGTDPLGICQHPFHMVDHHPVKHTRSGILVLLPFFALLELGNPVGTLWMLIPHVLYLLGQLVLPGTGRTEFGVERPAAPGGLDDQDRLLQLFLHVDSESELGADFAA